MEIYTDHKWVSVSEKVIKRNDIYRCNDDDKYVKGEYVSLMDHGDFPIHNERSSYIHMKGLPVLSMTAITAQTVIQEAFSKGFLVFPSEIILSFLDEIICDDYAIAKSHHWTQYIDKRKDVEDYLVALSEVNRHGHNFIEEL